MSEEPELDNTASTRKAKPFPRRCLECGKDEVWPATIPYDAKVKHDGKVHEFHIPELKITQCRDCGEEIFTNTADDQISDVLRKHLHLLSPEEIRSRLKKLGLRQKDLAQRIGVAPETVSRWVGDVMIQSRAMDNLMRVFFAFDNVREALAGGERPTVLT